jgi:hypothetical protein
LAVDRPTKSGTLGAERGFMRKTLITMKTAGVTIYLVHDPITADTTDWEFSPNRGQASLYSTNQATHLIRYFKLYKNPKAELHREYLDYLKGGISQ